MANFKAKLYEHPLVNDHFADDLAMCGPPPPGSFAVTQLIVDMMASKTNSYLLINRTLNASSYNSGSCFKRKVYEYSWTLIIEGFYGPLSDKSILYSDPEFYHRFIEAQKFAYAQRTLMGESFHD